MEREHGSLIAALQARANSNKPRPAIFTSLRRGMASLTAALIATLPTDRLHLNHTALSLKREGKLWCLRTANTNANGLPGKSKRHVHHILLATPIDATRTLLEPRDPEAAALIPTNASSAVLATFCWPSETAATFTIPPGFGFLVPPANQSAPPSTTSEGAGGFSPLNETHLKGALAPATPATEPQLLACTFVDQKFPHRAPTGARIIRTFFGGESAATLAPQSDDAVAAAAFTQLNKILGPIPTPDPNLTTIRRWPRSLPQYEVGHLDRMVTLDEHIAALGDLTLLGNAYRGVGVPDLIHAARTAAQALTTNH
jgi:oxygen-dependent protoporphyrinogen oxidase